MISRLRDSHASTLIERLGAEEVELKQATFQTSPANGDPPCELWSTRPGPSTFFSGVGRSSPRLRGVYTRRVDTKRRGVIVGTMRMFSGVAAHGSEADCSSANFLRLARAVGLLGVRFFL